MPAGPSTRGSADDREAVDRRDRHLIIGAGPCGLGLSAAFKRAGIPFDTVEATDDVGGNWHHGVYETVHIISSRRTTEFPDFPMPAHYPDFPSAAQMAQYMRAYAEYYGLRDDIAFNTRVLHVSPAPGDRWDVELQATGAATRGEVRRYGGVVVANGHHWDTRMPRYPGTFHGELIHSKDYKAPHQLQDKRVLVIGGGNSACDIAVEAARFGRAAHISMRRGYWFLPKTVFGVPSVEMIKPWLPVAAQRLLLRAAVRVIVGKYEAYGLQTPDHKIFEAHPSINSQLLYFIKHGRISPHPDIARWDGTHVEFVDGTREPFDLVVAATGYHVSLPMLADDVVQWDDKGFPNLIAGMLPPAHKNLYTFGMGQARYGIGPLITPGADLVAQMVKTQPRLRHPLGAVFARLGTKPPTTWLTDPMMVLRRVRVARTLLPHLHRLERRLLP